MGYRPASSPVPRDAQGRKHVKAVLLYLGYVKYEQLVSRRNRCQSKRKDRGVEPSGSSPPPWTGMRNMNRPFIGKMTETDLKG